MGAKQRYVYQQTRLGFNAFEMERRLSRLRFQTAHEQMAVARTGRPSRGPVATLLKSCLAHASDTLASQTLYCNSLHPKSHFL
jgi:hypothetical protein